VRELTYSPQPGRLTGRNRTYEVTHFVARLVTEYCGYTYLNVLVAEARTVFT